MDMMSLRRRVMVNQNKLMTATGNPITFNTPLTKPLKECVVRFTPQQEGSGTPSPENVREIVGKNGITVWQSNDDRSRPLPKEYQQVEYLESTGTQFIDVTQDYAMYETVVVAAVTKTRTNNAMICGHSLWNDTNRNCVIQNSASVGVCRRIGTNAWTNDAYINIEEYNAVNRILRFEIFKDHALVADATTGEELSRNDIELSQLPTMPVYLFHGASNSNNYVTRYISARIYKAIFYLNGETAYDLVPCYRKSDSVAGMYDLVSGTFYTNSGTGEFLVGEDIVAVETSVSFDDAPQDVDPSEVAGTIYGGYVDISKGVLVAKKDALVFDGSEAWNLYRNDENTCVYIYKPGRKPLNQNEICSHFAQYGSASGLGHPNTFVWGSASGYVYIQVPATLASDVTAFKQFLADEAQKGTPVTIVANPLEPIHYPLSPRILTTLRGNNVMWSDANGDLTVKYWTR